MIPVNASSFGRRRGMLRRYPGGTENDSIVLRPNPNTREASRGVHPLDTTRPPDPRVHLHPIHPPAFQSEQP